MNLVPKNPARIAPINGANGMRINKEGFNVDVMMFSIE
jgi:hypothetical protein